MPRRDSRNSLCDLNTLVGNVTRTNNTQAVDIQKRLISDAIEYRWRSVPKSFPEPGWVTLIVTRNDPKPGMLELFHRQSECTPAAKQRRNSRCDVWSNTETLRQCVLRLAGKLRKRGR